MSDMHDLLDKLLLHSQSPEKLDRVLGILHHISQQQERIMNTMDDVINDLADTKGKLDTLVTAFSDLRAQLASAGPTVTQAQIDAAFASVEAVKAEIVATMTPPAPPADPAPTA